MTGRAAVRSAAAAVGVVLWSALACAPRPAGRQEAVTDRSQDAITIRLHEPTEGDSRTVFEVSSLAAAGIACIRSGDLTPEALAGVLAVHALRPTDEGRSVPDRPAMFGEYTAEGGALQFIPRYPLVPGVRYRAVLDLSKLPRHSGTARTSHRAKRIVADFVLPKPGGPTTVLTHVYPSAGTLPENLLKFYLHFSAPMSQGRAYQRIHLLDGNGRKIEGAFLELGEELWDREGKRFTLFLDPGRIKHGLRSHQDMGPVLVQGKDYTLVVDRDWQDARGEPLAEGYRKRFRAGPPDADPPDPQTWDVLAPSVGPGLPLVVRFPESMDHALLHRLIVVTDPSGGLVRGNIDVDERETRWRFVPDRAWQAGTYNLEVTTTLEDLAGNSIGRPFEVDVFGPIGRRITAKTVKRPFAVRRADTSD